LLGLGPHRIVRRYRQPGRLRLAGADAAWARHLRGLRAVEIGNRAADEKGPGSVHAMNGEIETRLIGEADFDLLVSADTSVFDNPVDPVLARAYLAHPATEIALATDGGKVVGMATGVYHFHPDKKLE